MKRIIVYVSLTSLFTISFTNERASAAPLYIFPGLIDFLEGLEDISQIAAISSVALSVGSSVSLTVGLKGEEGEEEERQRFQQRFNANPRAMKRDLKRLSGPEYTWLTSTLLNIEPANQKQLRCALNNQKTALEQLIDQTAYTMEKSKKQRVNELYHFIAQVTREVEAGTLQDQCKSEP